MKKISLYVLLLTALCTWTSAKDQPFQVITWPDSGPSLVRFRFSKFKDIDGMGKEGTFVTETIAENLSSKTISGASFSLYIFDKSKARISERYVNLTNVAAGQTVKFQMTMSASWHSRFGGHRDERSADHVYHR